MEYDLLLHKDVYLPQGVKNVALRLQKSIKKGQYSYHLLTDRLENPDLKHNYTDSDLDKALSSIINEPVEPFEVGLNKYPIGWCVDKYCVRVSYDNKVDIIIVLTAKGKVITAYCNLKTDNHKTLRKERYNTKEDYERLMKR